MLFPGPPCSQVFLGLCNACCAFQMSCTTVTMWVLALSSTSGGDQLTQLNEEGTLEGTTLCALCLLTSQKRLQLDSFGRNLLELQSGPENPQPELQHQVSSARARLCFVVNISPYHWITKGASCLRFQRPTTKQSSSLSHFHLQLYQSYLTQSACKSGLLEPCPISSHSGLGRLVPNLFPYSGLAPS